MYDHKPLHSPSLCVFSLDAICFGVFTIVSQSVEMTLRTYGQTESQAMRAFGRGEAVSPHGRETDHIWAPSPSVRASKRADGPNYKPLNRTLVDGKAFGGSGASHSYSSVPLRQTRVQSISVNKETHSQKLPDMRYCLELLNHIFFVFYISYSSFLTKNTLIWFTWFHWVTILNFRKYLHPLKCCCNMNLLQKDTFCIAL